MADKTDVRHKIAFVIGECHLFFKHCVFSKTEPGDLAK
jgi:hypothetical protein